MSRISFPEIPAEALKGHAEPERVERVWRRLELDLRTTPRPTGLRGGWLIAGAVAVFGLGVAFGVRLRAPVVEVSAVAEPPVPLSAPGTGPAIDSAAPASEPGVPPVHKNVRPRRVAPRDEAPVLEYTETYVEPTPAPVHDAASVSGPAEWEMLAEAGDFQAAKVALDRDGGFARARARASASQLLVLADVARASGSREQAAQALRRVLAVYDSAPEAPLAAWTLGNLLEQAGDREGAAEAYATYRRLSPTGDFAEDAAARQVDAALSQGNLELGTRAMEEYAQNFPKGRRMAELRKRLAALASASDASGAPADTDEDDESGEQNADAPPPAPAEQR